jgi:hypothetical protein
MQSMEKITGKAEKILVFLMHQDRDKIWDLSIHIEKRSLSQNAYYWQLLGKTAASLKIGRAELHNRMLRDYGQIQWIDGHPVTVEIPDTDKAEEMALKADTFHIKPTDQIIEKGGQTYRVYIMLRGSHEYNTWEMSVLLNGMVQEAENVGIETMTPKELEELREYEEKHHHK